MAEGSTSAPASIPWWERRAFIAALVLLSMVPLLYPPVPPLVDLLGHMGRYRVQLDLDSSPSLSQYYDFQWAAIGNLGVDLLIMPLAPVFGLELAVKLIVMAIPPLTVAGFLWVAREVHGRVPPTALFALPFAYSHPFMFGFVNFALSMALALLAFALWLRLARKNRFRLRAMLFVPISIVLFFAHTFGWGVLGLLCFSAEAVRQHDKGSGWLRSGVNAALHAAVMALPLVFILTWRSEAADGTTAGWFDFETKAIWLVMVLRDRWLWLDAAGPLVSVVVIAAALYLPRLTFSRNLAFSALVLLACFVLLPWTVFGSAYADMRLIPYVLPVALLAIRFRADTHLKTARVFAVLGLAFYLVRIAGNTASLAIAAEDQRQELEALRHVPVGAKVVSLVGRPCGAWALNRNIHLGGLVIVRKHGFSNDQWIMDGMNLLQVRFKGAGYFWRDPSQMVKEPSCGGMGVSPDYALSRIPVGSFDYLWLVDPPQFDESLVRDWQPVFRSGESRLYRLPRGG